MPHVKPHIEVGLCNAEERSIEAWLLSSGHYLPSLSVLVIGRVYTVCTWLSTRQCRSALTEYECLYRRCAGDTWKGKTSSYQTPNNPVGVRQGFIRGDGRRDQQDHRRLLPFCFALGLLPLEPSLCVGCPRRFSREQRVHAIPVSASSSDCRLQTSDSPGIQRPLSRPSTQRTVRTPNDSPDITFNLDPVCPPPLRSFSAPGQSATVAVLICPTPPSGTIPPKPNHSPLLPPRITLTPPQHQPHPRSPYCCAATYSYFCSTHFSPPSLHQPAV